MIVILPISSTGSRAGVRNYLRASREYLQSTSHYRTMRFDFPRKCPLCGRFSCVEWKGYYVRRIQDIAWGLGRIVIRWGRCRHYKTRFSLLPDFLIPRLRMTRRSVEAIRAGLRGRGTTLQAAVDACFFPWNEANYLAVSTVHFALRQLTYEAWSTEHQDQQGGPVSGYGRPSHESAPERFGSVSRKSPPHGRTAWMKIALHPRMRGPPPSMTSFETDPTAHSMWLRHLRLRPSGDTCPMVLLWTILVQLVVEASGLYSYRNVGFLHGQKKATAVCRIFKRAIKVLFKLPDRN